MCKQAWLSRSFQKLGVALADRRIGTIGPSVTAACIDSVALARSPALNRTSAVVGPKLG